MLSLWSGISHSTDLITLTHPQHSITKSALHAHAPDVERPFEQLGKVLPNLLPVLLSIESRVPGPRTDDVLVRIGLIPLDASLGLHLHQPCC